ncbi:metallophosphoesterase [Limnoglobus roseus]|uniref:Metallophosphoesterase n=1 Tax=Limnoglobus roseus TaxID=2598579 RepID=A0A5C1ADY3_9BACT|nr:metallophosphoesterase [Limnoglobus roseus]
MIPSNTDILLLHDPPKDYGALAPRPRGVWEHTGSQSLINRIRVVRPHAVVCGHIHECYGVYRDRDTTIYNSSLINKRYEIVNGPTSQCKPTTSFNPMSPPMSRMSHGSMRVTC